MGARLILDRHVVETLMPDLVGHDHQPSAFIVYLYLWSQARGRGERRATASLQRIASDTGLSKSAVQYALRTLRRRRLVTSRQAYATSVPTHVLHTPWVRPARA
ncbi:MAG TPA: helix-turn-helix domain-containing protein [Vicinamibacterales bacterium]|nr:helix-turn-helix domain-containing protein [Vicinamibacterales bacterium]